MQSWCRAFYDGYFYDLIRSMHGITYQTEREYLNTHREKLIKAGVQDVDTPISEPFDFSKVAVNKVINPDVAIA